MNQIKIIKPYYNLVLTYFFSFYLGLLKKELSTDKYVQSLKIRF